MSQSNRRRTQQFQPQALRAALNCQPFDSHVKDNDNSAHYQSTTKSSHKRWILAGRILHMVRFPDQSRWAVPTVRIPLA
jgi:hypothetical protein